MRQRYLVSLGALIVVLALVSWATVFMAGQTPAAPKPAAATAAKPYAGPRTPWGDPDLQGVWFVLAAVPLERSAANAGKEFLTDAEIAAADKGKEVNPGRNARSANGTQDVEGAYNAVFNSILKTGKRTSMITDPPDGKIPPLVTPAAQGGRGGGRGGRGGGSPNDNPETLAQNPRCLGVELPFLPLNTAFAQGTVMQLVQSPKSMGMYMEDDHAGGGNRVILFGNQPHLSSNIHTYLGDSRAHWEGGSLVVETTNLSRPYRGANPDTFKMVEKFTRLDNFNLKREITFIDPKTWTKPWTVMIEMGKTSDNRHMIFDSACHEGNYGMTGVLVGSRKEEQAAKK